MTRIVTIWIGHNTEQSHYSLGGVQLFNITSYHILMEDNPCAWYCHLSLIGRIRPYLSTEVTKDMIHAYIASKLDKNSLRTQRRTRQNPQEIVQFKMPLQNPVRLIGQKNNHVTDLLYQLHWFPVHRRLGLKILLCWTFKALNHAGPKYLTSYNGTNLLNSYVHQIQSF